MCTPSLTLGPACISACPRRFLSLCCKHALTPSCPCISQRLASLGALLRGDRKAIGAGSELKEFDVDNAHGEKALLRVLNDVTGEQGSKPMPGVQVRARRGRRGR